LGQRRDAFVLLPNKVKVKLILSSFQNVQLDTVMVPRNGTITNLKGVNMTKYLVKVTRPDEAVKANLREGSEFQGEG